MRPLPDIEDSDEALAARLRPLVAAVVPGGAALPPPPEPPRRGRPPKAPKVPKPPRSQIELLLPNAVIAKLKAEAFKRNISTTTRVLEILRDAGYPVTKADFQDNRRGRKVRNHVS